MDMETTISQGTRAVNENAAYDAACKRLLSEKIILAWIMKNCLEEYRRCDVKEIAEKYIEGQPQVGEAPVLPDGVGTIIHGLDTEDKTVNEGTVAFDIRFYAVAPMSGEQIRLIINVEAQSRFYSGYPLTMRGIYYCSRMISSQYGKEFTNAHYEKIRKVYSIWICMNPPKSRKNTITRYRMTEENLVGDVREAVRNYDLLSVIMVCLGGPEDRNYDGVFRLLDVLLSAKTSAAEKQQVLQEDFDIPMTQTFESEVSMMCNLSEGVWEEAMREGMAQGMERGMAQGMERGMVQGMERGMAQGLEQGRLAAVENLMKNMGLSMEQAMAVLEIPESEHRKYAKHLEKQ